MNFKIILAIILSLLLITSCAVTKEQHGNYDSSKYQTETIKKGKDFYLFWDKLPIKRIDKKLDIENYEKVIKRGFFDATIYYGTLGIFSFYSVKIKAPKEDRKTNRGR